MASCRWVRRHLTAWVDGELAASPTERLARHVAGCAACAAETAALTAAIRWQRQALARIVADAGSDYAPLGARVQRAVAAEPERSRARWGWLLRPVAVAGAALAVVVAVFMSAVGGPPAVLIPLGVESPPVPVAREPELYKDYQLIQRLDALENFDSVEAMPLDDEQTSQHG